MKAKKIIHILPTNGIGGAEIAASSSIGIRNECYSLFVKFLYKTATQTPFQSFFYEFQDLNRNPNRTIRLRILEWKPVKDQSKHI